MPPEETNSGTESAEADVKQPANPILIDVTRNDATVRFTEQATTKGANPGRMVFEPDTTDEAKLLRFVGVSPEVAEALKQAEGKVAGTISNVIGIIRQKLRAVTLEVAKDNTDADSGVFDEEGFIKDMIEFDSAGETLGDLKDVLKEYNQKVSKLDFSAPNVNDKLLELGLKIKEIQKQIDKKSRPKKVVANSTSQAVAA
jgi:hypothetical protein